jgi:myo-inositol 2-dehydrogenase / D-chiro-inositol 1-dehydrogenase
MRFALLGTDGDGLALAWALAATGRHEVAAHTRVLPADVRARLGPGARLERDLEEVLADPAIDAVIVASPLPERAAELRRALQSERHVLCAYPSDATPDAAYEAAMIQRDTGCVLLPLLPGGLHPGLRRLAELVGRPGTGRLAPLGEMRLVEVEWSSPDVVLIGDTAGRNPSLPGWEVLRALGGEIAEVTAFTEGEHLTAHAPVFVSGRFEQGGQFQEALRPRQPGLVWRVSVTGSHGRGVLSPAPVGGLRLSWQNAEGVDQEEAWDGWDPWAALAAVFEEAVAGRAAGTGLSWQDAIRALELDDAARRSVQRRRATVLEHPEPTEEAGFKGTMTLLGCGLLWLFVLLLVLSVWWPVLGWLIAPLLLAFLGLQLFLGVARRKTEGEDRGGERGSSVEQDATTGSPR